MGEMADYTLSLGDDQLEREPHVCFDKAAACGYCWARPLYWRTVAGRWRLHTRRGEIHECDACRAVRRRWAESNQPTPRGSPGEEAGR